MMDHMSPTSPILYTSISPATTDSTFATSPVKTEDGSLPKPPKKKQKRNKPTLSCEECVERKTKVSKKKSNLHNAPGLLLHCESDKRK